MMKTLSIGYIPLIDSALLHIARAYDFAADEGLQLDLIRDTSWANIRDKLGAGIFDAAHMLAPSAMAACLGLGTPEIALVAPVALGLDGNAITLSEALYADVQAEIARVLAQPEAADAYCTAQALAKVVTRRRETGREPLKFAHVFPFSSHHYQLRLWFAAGGIDPKTDIDLVVVPPPFMVESLTSGLIDGFCVGAPWNGLAVVAGVGHIIHPCCDIVCNCPEKLLAFRADVAARDPESVAALSRAIWRAADWAIQKNHTEDLAYLLKQDAGLDAPLELLCQVLDPERDVGVPRARLRLDRASTFAHPAHAAWLYAQMQAAGQIGAGFEAKASTVYRPDLTGFSEAGTSPELDLKNIVPQSKN
jgi:NitT/TauT family transport system ATP-binding protein